jgi:acyl carrier protein
MGALADTVLKKEIKLLIIATLNIGDVTPEEVEDDAPLFGQDNVLGLDSIDALEIVMMLQEKYGVRLDDKNQARFILQNISTIAEFIAERRTK